MHGRKIPCIFLYIDVKMISIFSALPVGELSSEADWGSNNLPVSTLLPLFYPNSFTHKKSFYLTFLSARRRGVSFSTARKKPKCRSGGRRRLKAAPIPPDTHHHPAFFRCLYPTAQTHSSRLHAFFHYPCLQWFMFTISARVSVPFPLRVWFQPIQYP